MVSNIKKPNNCDDVPGDVILSVEEFVSEFDPYEYRSDEPVYLFYDKKSGAFYLVCHLQAKTITSYTDIEATLDGSDEDEIYKLNREVTEDHVAYKQMEDDAIKGRSFEDIVIEYDTSYNSEYPLKVFSGQHRVKAIKKAVDNNVAVMHGLRVYFCLDRDQKVEIAMVNNTSIAVSNDLLDRMREQLLGNELRLWAQETGLLGESQDFSDRGNSGVPTVRMARTILVNFYKGREQTIDGDHKPDVCKSGGVDNEYLELRAKINWKDPALLEMGKQLARLHKTQQTIVQNRSVDNNAQYAKKTLSLSLLTSWSYAAGLFQQDSAKLQKFYSLPDSVSPPADPLNAKAMGQARLIGVDNDTYRGLGTRSNSTEYGRLLELFIIYASRDDVKKITDKLANAAIKSYHAKDSQRQANKALENL